jgi:hypothetical protein
MILACCTVTEVRLEHYRIYWQQLTNEYATVSYRRCDVRSCALSPQVACPCHILYKTLKIDLVVSKNKLYSTSHILYDLNATQFRKAGRATPQKILYTLMHVVCGSADALQYGIDWNGKLISPNQPIDDSMQLLTYGERPLVSAYMSVVAAYMPHSTK